MIGSLVAKITSAIRTTLSQQTGTSGKVFQRYIAKAIQSTHPAVPQTAVEEKNWRLSQHLMQGNTSAGARSAPEVQYSQWALIIAVKLTDAPAGTTRLYATLGQSTSSNHTNANQWVIAGTMQCRLGRDLFEAEHPLGSLPLGSLQDYGRAPTETVTTWLQQYPTEETMSLRGHWVQQETLVSRRHRLPGQCRTTSTHQQP